MIPPKCITCGKFLADIEVEWITYKEYCFRNKSKLKEPIDDLLAKKLDELHVHTRCCRSQVLTSVDLVRLLL